MGNVILAQVTLAIANVLGYLLTLYWWIVLIAVVLSFVNPDPHNAIVRFLRSVTEPVFYQVRRWMPFVVISGIDLSPIVVGLVIMVLQTVVVDSLRQLAFRLSALGSGIPLG